MGENYPEVISFTTDRLRNRDEYTRITVTSRVNGVPRAEL